MRVIKRRFELDEAATDELVAEATAAEHEAVDLYHFTSLINRSLDEAGRRRVVEMMWEIVYADGRVTEFEDNLIWRAADLLGVSSRERIELRQQVAGAGGSRAAQRPKVPAWRAASRHLDHRGIRRHRGGARARVRRQRPRARAGGAARAAARPRSPTRSPRTGAPRPHGAARSIWRASMPAAGSARRSRPRGVEPDIVVNNAGFGLIGAAAALDRGEQLAMIDLNVRALTDLSLAFVGRARAPPGGILNVASVAGFLPGPGMAVYYASKAYVLSFSEALHHELAPRGVRVTALCPGPVPTEFQARAGVKTTTLSPPHRALRRAGGARTAIAACRKAAAWWCRASPTG